MKLSLKPCYLSVIACLVWLSGCQEPIHAPSQNTATRSQAIVNGTREPLAIALSDQQVLAVGWLYPNGAPSDNFCTGTLITERVVATASHCVAGSSGSAVGFGMGTLPTDPEAFIPASDIYTHPAADAALIVLSRDATEELDVEPIPVNTEAVPDALLGQPIQAGGYGQTYDRDRYGRWFATVYLDSIDSDQIHVDGRGEQGICYGDSGGPAIAVIEEGGEPTLLAVESWGDSSCVDVDHMTRLDVLYADWIEPILNGDTPEDPCDGLDYLGRCNGNVAEWCQRGTLQTRDCTAMGTTCEYLNDQVGFICGCGELSYLGRCNGDVAEYCDDGAFREVNCQARGQGCAWVNGEIGYFCTDNPQCTPEDEAGHCDGDVAVNCTDGFTTREDCAFTDEQCDVTGEGAACSSNTSEPPPDASPDAGGDAVDIDLGSVGPEITVVDSPDDSESGCGCGVTSTNSPSTPGILVVCCFAATLRRRP